MNITRDRDRRLVRSHEILLSLNVAEVLVLGLILGDGVFLPFVELANRINHALGLKTGTATGGYLAVALYTLVLTVALILVSPCLRRTPSMERVWLVCTGLLALSATPVCWFWIQHRYDWYPVEVAAYVLLAMLYLRQRWPLPAYAIIVAVGVHYGFWFLRYREYTLEPLRLSTPVIGFCACATWATYVRARGRKDRAGLNTPD